MAPLSPSPEQSESMTDRDVTGDVTDRDVTMRSENASPQRQEPPREPEEQVDFNFYYQYSHLDITSPIFFRQQRACPT